MNKNFAELSLGSSLYMIVVVISLAIGVYGTARVALNTVIFEKYPVSSMMPMMYGEGTISQKQTALTPAMLWLMISVEQFYH